MFLVCQSTIVHKVGEVKGGGEPYSFRVYLDSTSDSSKRSRRVSIDAVGEETMSAAHSVENLEEITRVDDEVLESYTKIWNSVLPEKSQSRTPNLTSSSSPCNFTHAETRAKPSHRFQARIPSRKGRIDPRD